MSAVEVDRWAAHTPYSDPGRHAGVLAGLPGDVAGLGRVLRGVVTHYRGGGQVLTGERLAEIDHRWVEAMLATDQARCPGPWTRPRAQPLVGCCRDFALVTVAALRERGVAARTRVGFASYLNEGFWTDHVVSEYWDGGRWVWADTQLDPAGPWPVDVLDIPRAPEARGAVLASAAQVWLAHRAGEVDAERYGVHPDLPWRGAGFVRAYVLLELAHRQGEEVLLWDTWEAMRAEDDGVFDEVARLLVAADGGDGAAERELAYRYARGGRLNPGGRVLCASPSGFVGWVDLVRRVVEPG
ncbi:transglutaminase domain-containing protein [Nocardiopsis sp. HUAS JQ3]|uniref:transglutaminase domain-containing protein n=1 Tax=Nocardiopsis sp. HUAS JQ3 TaxID=3061629 RepID=UPI0023A9FC31|nr:transglutaminase domain-containing protein [Nocardiopsis sp. HUAS JQ3]WDZ93652.1 transglutaminase domain-containing protein [Nocardiopsis sp. HUAS JQ3]